MSPPIPNSFPELHEGYRSDSSAGETIEMQETKTSIQHEIDATVHPQQGVNKHVPHQYQNDCVVANRSAQRTPFYESRKVEKDEILSRRDALHIPQTHRPLPKCRSYQNLLKCMADIRRDGR